jgi:hypothetical protein
MSVRGALASLALLATAGGGACSGGGAPRACDGTRIERFRELEIVDEAIVGDPRAKNAGAGPWSFRHAMEELAPSPIAAGGFVRGWLDAWSAADPERGAGLQARVVCPWLRATAGNGCDEACARCTASALDLDAAPFRLIAIANRIDLGRMPDARSPAGEGRLVFAVTDGPGDVDSAAALDATVILEYALPGGSPADWAGAWHALSAFDEPDDGYKQALAGVTEAFVRRSASGASALSQVRVQEAAFGPSRVFRELALDESGALAPRGLRNTPRAALNDAADLRGFVTQNRSAVLADLHVLPAAMRADAIDGALVWTLGGVDEPLRKAFAEGTCNGCHVSEAASLDGFHVSPHALGVAKLSPFVNDPTRRGADDLARREEYVQALLCGE